MVSAIERFHFNVFLWLVQFILFRSDSLHDWHESGTGDELLQNTIHLYIVFTFDTPIYNLFFGKLNGFGFDDVIRNHSVILFQAD